MRTTILLTAALGFSLAASVATAAEGEREAYAEIREQLANEELDAAEEQLDKALQLHPDSQQLRSLHGLLHAYLRRAERHGDAARHAEASAEHRLTTLRENPRLASSFGSVVRQMTSAYMAAGEAETALEKLDEFIAQVESIHTEAEAVETKALLAELRAHKAVLLAEQGQADEANQLLAALRGEAEEALDSAGEDVGNVLALAHILAARAELVGTPEDVAAARQEHREFLAEQAKAHSDAAPIVSAYYSQEISAINELARSDAKRASERIAELEEFFQSLDSDDPAVERLVDSSERMLASLKRRIESALVQQALIGQSAFPLDAEAWVNGDPLTDEDLKGKVVLLDFWAVWCGPCIATFPHLREWREKYGDQGLVIIGATRHYGYDWDDEAKSIKRVEDLSPEDEQAAMVRFAEHYELEHPFMVMPEGSDFSKKYGVTGIPTAVLVDREGIVRMIRVGSGEENAKELEALIEELVHGTSESAGG